MVRAEPTTDRTPHRPAQPAVVEVADRTGRLGPAPSAWLLDRARAAASELGVAGEVRVAVVDDPAMAAAHERYAGVPGTTDVLTFDYAADAPTAVDREPHPLDSDILICFDEATRHAAERDHPIERELLLYVVHGLLHCLGHDDHDEADAAAMHRREDEVLTTIGVGPTYAAPSRGAAGEAPR
ncbi:MAG: rRNA maturation RNase YbeY [Phycisphaerales bacterium]